MAQIQNDEMLTHIKTLVLETTDEKISNRDQMTVTKVTIHGFERKPL